jgi:PAS domain S-box-containing protein
MNPLSIGSLSGAVVALSVAGFVLSKDTKSPANRAFAIAALTAAYHSITEFGLRQAETMDTAEFWLKVLSGWPVVFVVLLHFVLTVTNIRGRLRLALYTFAIVPALILVSVTATTDLFITGAVEKYWGWTFAVNTDSWPLYLALAWLPSMIVLSIVLPIRHYLRTQDHRERQQVKFLIIAISAPLIVWGVSELVLPWFGVSVPNLASPTYAFGLALIGYAIWKHQLFALTPAAAAEEIIAAMSDILLLLNSQGVITAANRTALDIAGYDRNELVGASADLIFPDAEYRTALSRNTQPSDSHDNGVHTGIEVSLAKRSGERVPVLLSMSVMRERDGEPLGVVCIGMDLTERKQSDAARRDLEVRALAQSKLATIGEVATGVAHEINQPLTYISTMLQATQEDIELDDLDDVELRQRLAESYRQVGRITNIVDHLRAFGRSEDLSKEPVELDSVLDNALLLLEGRLTQLGITFVRTSEEALPPVRGSSSQLEQVLINLFQNAIDALSDNAGDGRIHVTMSKSSAQDQITISFADNGEGIAPGDLDQVFVPFFSTKEVGKGTGLGLSIVHSIIRDHGGTVTCESELGAGTVVGINLPVSTGSEPA